MEDGASPSGLSRYYKGAKQSSNSSANNLINSTCNGPVTDSGAGYQPKKV